MFLKKKIELEEGKRRKGTFSLNKRKYSCPIELTLSVIGGKWKILILWNLMEGARRYSELKYLLKEITHKMLIQQLKELVADGIINRKVFNEVPLRVEYRLNKEGIRLSKVISSMREWGFKYLVK
jgi:DNA-binding HxlR family transcriptional regulator